MPHYCYKERPIAISDGKEVRVEVEMEELVLGERDIIDLDYNGFQSVVCEHVAPASLGNFSETQTH